MIVSYFKFRFFLFEISDCVYLFDIGVSQHPLRYPLRFHGYQAKYWRKSRQEHNFKISVQSAVK
jgi:hypothetical protein